ncbi:hypothetical protein [Thermoanaerobacter thermocopriae]|nr:hypothetical protein [Thermoanaerobacter thermocopriae]
MKEIGQQLKKHLLTGISYMIPLVIAGAVIMAIARIGATPFGIKDIWDPKYAQNANALIRILHDFDSFGGVALGLMLPVISAYIAIQLQTNLVLPQALLQEC